MQLDFAHATLGRIKTPVHRLGLSATYRPGKKAIYKAFDEGVNFFFCFGLDTQMIGVLREVLKKNREKYVVATGAYNYIWWHQNLRRTLEKRLRQLATDYIDVFLFLGVMKKKEFEGKVREELLALRGDSRVRAVGISTHNRKFAGELAAQNALDVLMVRYNAAHRGAEQEIFPYVNPADTGVVNHTATRWTYLLRRPRGWPKDQRIPTAGMSYRFVLSSPHVDVCLTAPRSVAELDENLAALRQGPLSEEETEFMRRFGDAVYNAKKWFM